MVCFMDIQEIVFQVTKAHNFDKKSLESVENVLKSCLTTVSVIFRKSLVYLKLLKITLNIFKIEVAPQKKIEN